MNINAYIFYRLYPLKHYSSISCTPKYIVHRCKRNNEYLSKQNVGVDERKKQKQQQQAYERFENENLALECGREDDDGMENGNKS